MFGRQPSRDQKDALSQRIKRASGRLSDEPGSQSVEARPQGTSPPSKRISNRPPREAMFRDVLIELPGGGRVTAVVRNISATGARVDFGQRVALPGRVRVSISSLSIFRNARVVWQDERSAGLEFL